MKKKSFTLIEMVLVTVILAAIAVMIAPFINVALDAWVVNKTERNLVFSARLATNRMVREMREIKDTDSITTFTETEFEFLDINDNTINYQQSSSLLLRNSDELATMLQDPGGLSFSYLDSSGNPTGTKSNIRMVRMTLTLISGDISITLESLAKLRNVS